jgi:hypothetical protein
LPAADRHHRAIGDELQAIVAFIADAGASRGQFDAAG